MTTDPTLQVNVNMKSSDTEATLTIGDLAQRFGLATHVLRHWEAMGLIAPATRVNGRRRYSEGQAARVATIVHSKQAGLRLDQLRDILAAPTVAVRRELLREHRADLERRIREIKMSQEMITHAMECDADDFTLCAAYRKIIAAGHAAEPARHTHPHGRSRNAPKAARRTDLPITR